MKKEHILQEIKRTAKTNGGKPFGQQRFESETGIKRYDWLGVHWARWGDAVREAGFAPNQFNSAYDKAELLDKYAKLAQELGRLPTAVDLRLKARRDSGFPSHNTFTRIGSKSKLIEQLIDYCRNRKGYEDVVSLCEAYTSTHRNLDVSDESDSQEVEIGFVYLTKSGRFYKIGKTNAAGRRERELALQLPEKATTVHVIRTDDPTGIEAYWHKRFGSKWKNGELFDLNAVDVAMFKRRKFM
ncbi:MAG TPA: GIY-YIG nuclease family protein [Nitrospiraceae bacterium]|nr:GIY-YIG nuclease family protein [Nitrospiraceae bacterium]